MLVKLSDTIRYNDEIYVEISLLETAVFLQSISHLLVMPEENLLLMLSSISVHGKCFHFKQGEYIF